MFFAKEGCELLSVYEKSTQSLDYVCSCGARARTNLHGFRRLQQSHYRACWHGRVATNHAEVSRYFSEHGCTLLSLEYHGCNDRLRYMCGCGAQAVTTFRVFKYKVDRNLRRGCQHCRLDRMMETTRASNGGVHHFQTGAFLDRRVATNLERYGVGNPLQSEAVKRKREATNMRKYGVISVSQVPEIVRRQREGFRRKYGVEHFMQNAESREKFRRTLLERYGVPSLAFASRRSSREAQAFFEQVFSRLPPETRDKCYFSPRTREFNVWKDGAYYKYDFVHSAFKKAIEYNGSRFHPRPEQDPDEVGWCLFRPTRTVREAREYEARKLGAIRARGFDVLVVWDYERRHDEECLVERCLHFLLRLTPGTTP